MSSDGRYVAFYSEANNLVTGDTNGGRDVFVRDRDTSTTERVSVGSAGAQGNDWSDGAPISADGRYVAFRSAASNLVPGDTNIAIDVFLRDRTMGATERVSMDSADAQGNGTSWTVSITADGRYVAFQSEATTLVPGDTNGVDDVFVRDRVAWVAVGGVAEQPDVTALPSAAAPAGRGYAVYIMGAAAALVVALGAAGWRKRRA
jgi:Tol biopolymer transport system component